MDHSDTIAAIATSSTGGGISVIRISGEDALLIADKIYTNKNNKKISKQDSHTIHYGYIHDDNKIIDEVMVLIMKGPRSYTKEDVVEIDCHGGAFVCKKILECIIKNGARIAEPGEFTKRAFLNGRIDLSQAEAVIDIINAKNQYALESSVSQLRGSIKTEIIELRDKIVHDIAFIEAALDDPEHISIDGYADKLELSVKEYLSECNHLKENSENGRIIKEGINTVIIGKPNVGKSSLMNLLLRSDRAIVTDVPGTTRDTLEEEIRIGEIQLNIKDTAGIRDTNDVVEQIGIKKAKESLENADFVICVFDQSDKLSKEDYEILEETKNIPGVILCNKSDISSQIILEDISKISDKEIIPFSTKTGVGLDQLESFIKTQFYHEKLSFNDEIYISSLRQKEALMDAISSLQKVQESIELGMSEDFFSIDLTDAYISLGKIIGETLEDDIVDTIFREFCMGK